jgi:biopolymer transport protein ExbD
MKFARKDKYKIRANVDLTPLIDVVFQLLIFFMLSATFVVQSSIPIETPEATTSESQIDSKDVSLTLQFGEGGPDGEGPVFINDTVIPDWAALTVALTQLREENPEVLVLIRPDQRVSTGRLVKVMDIANSVGIEKYLIAAQQPAGSD